MWLRRDGPARQIQTLHSHRLFFSSFATCTPIASSWSRMTRTPISFPVTPTSYREGPKQTRNVHFFRESEKEETKSAGIADRSWLNSPHALECGVNCALGGVGSFCVRGREQRV